MLEIRLTWSEIDLREFLSPRVSLRDSSDAETAGQRPQPGNDEEDASGRPIQKYMPHVWNVPHVC